MALVLIAVALFTGPALARKHVGRAPKCAPGTTPVQVGQGSGGLRLNSCLPAFVHPSRQGFSWHEAGPWLRGGLLGPRLSSRSFARVRAAFARVDPLMDRVDSLLATKLLPHRARLAGAGRARARVADQVTGGAIPPIYTDGAIIHGTATGLLPDTDALGLSTQVGDIIDSTAIVDYTGGPLKNKGVLRETSGRGQGAIVDSCPSATGEVSGKAASHLAIGARVARGFFGTHSFLFDESAKATLLGHVGEDALLKTFDYQATLVVKVVESGQPSREYHVTFSGAGINPHALSPDAPPLTTQQYLSNLRATLAAAVVTSSNGRPVTSMSGVAGDIMTTAIAQAKHDIESAASSEFLNAQKNWYDNYNCVTLEVSPDAVLKPGDVTTVSVQVRRNADHQPVVAHVKADLYASPDGKIGTVDNANPLTAPPDPANISFTAPAQHWKRGTGMLVDATSRAGRANFQTWTATTPILYRITRIDLTSSFTAADSHGGGKPYTSTWELHTSPTPDQSTGTFAGTLGDARIWSLSVSGPESTNVQDGGWTTTGSPSRTYNCHRESPGLNGYAVTLYRSSAPTVSITWIAGVNRAFHCDAGNGQTEDPDFPFTGSNDAFSNTYPASTFDQPKFTLPVNVDTGDGQTITGSVSFEMY